MDSFLQAMLLRPFQPLTAYVNAQKSAPSTMLSRFDDLSVFVSWYCFQDIARYLFLTIPMESILCLLLSVRPELQSAIKDCIRGMRKNFYKLYKARQSGEEKQSIARINGHPSAIVQSHYFRTNMFKVLGSVYVECLNLI
jgi:hypothetical protein